jgi:DNA-binding response OmpR family regulator
MLTSTPGRIALIDDDVHVLISVKRMLERQGYSVAVHDGGPGCCKEVANFKPDLVLVDVRMPFLSGDAFVTLLGKNAGTIRPTVVLFSAIDEMKLEQMARECGADGYISKSDSTLEFARKIASFLRLSAGAVRKRDNEPAP